MPRLPEIARGDVSDPRVIERYDRLFEGRDPVAEPGTRTGTKGDWWTVFANSPDTFADAVKGFAFYQSADRKLSPRLRELGQTRAGWLVGSQFVFSQHCKAGRAAGLSAEQVAAIPHWEVSDLFDANERAVLAYTDYLVSERGRVPEPVFEALRGFLSSEEILELTYITAMYAMHAMVTKALRLEFDDRDDPIVEVAAPSGASDADIMAMRR